MSARVHDTWRQYTWNLSVLLPLSGDIQLNPGPICYPCGVCKKKAVSCDLYECWFHIKCANLSANHYSYLCEQVDFNRQCSSCLFSNLPYHDVSNETLTRSCVIELSVSIPMTGYFIFIING